MTTHNTPISERLAEAEETLLKELDYAIEHAGEVQRGYGGHKYRCISADDFDEAVKALADFRATKLAYAAEKERGAGEVVCYMRYHDGVPDWAEDCVTANPHSEHHNSYKVEDGYAWVPLYSAPTRAKADSLQQVALDAAEIARLKAIEHHCWHLLDDSEDNGITTCIHNDASKVDLDALNKLLPEGHPEVKEPKQPFSISKKKHNGPCWRMSHSDCGC